MKKCDTFVEKKAIAAAKSSAKSTAAKSASLKEKKEKSTIRKAALERRRSLLETLRDFSSRSGKPEKTAPLQQLEKGGRLVEQSKYVTTLEPSEPAVEPRGKQNGHHLPAGYGDNRIVIQVRDPLWLHAYWELTAGKFDALHLEFGALLNGARRLLRVYDITGIFFDGTNAHGYFDVEINPEANSWYLHVGNPGRSYCVDIGLLLTNGRFITLARSNFVTTPLAGPSWITDEEWMIVEEDFNRLYGLSVGFGVGLSSADIKRQISKRLKQQLSSGALSSPGASAGVQRGKPEHERKFWLVVNTELIVYGATEPDAQLTVQGRPVRLNKDGTFSLRFSLPDGEQVIPVKAVSADKVDERVITPIVTRRTE
ncbi:MAG: DUF4912 domain-containing protein [Candidatus Omnitrophica bacterium]|nr:DUF4912 domain-containing protein [Candidatus Omnitrophota bacterium]